MFWLVYRVVNDLYATVKLETVCKLIFVSLLLNAMRKSFL